MIPATYIFPGVFMYLIGFLPMLGEGLTFLTMFLGVSGSLLCFEGILMLLVDGDNVGWISKFYFDLALGDFIIPFVIESVSKVSGFEEALKESNNIEEVFGKFVKLIKKPLIVTDAKLEINDGKFTIKLENCLLAKRSLAIAGNGGIYPLAMSVAAMIQKILSKPIEIVSSSLLPNGSVTKIKVFETET